jgi:hypothetical protein
LINFFTPEKQEKFKQKLGNTDITSTVMNFIMQIDEEDIKEKKHIPVKHFMIDLRFMQLKPKLESINDTY